MSDSKASFFKQSGWMVGATFLGGVLMFGVHMLVNRMMSVAQYTELFTLLKIVTFISMPAGGLTTVFAHQAAAAVDDESRRRLQTCARVVAVATITVWLVMIAVVTVGQDWIAHNLQITSRAAFWMTSIVALTTLLIPLSRGLLQGAQRFGPMGWTFLSDGAIRFGGALVILLAIAQTAAGVMAAALLGQCVSLAAGLWWGRDFLARSGARVDWRAWFGKAVPLMLGSGVVVFFMAADAIFARSLFPEDEDIYKFYVPGNMVGFAMAQFAVPIAAVMFPRIVHGAATADKTEAFRWTLILTAIVGAAAALLGTFAPWLPVRVMFKGEYAGGSALVPWFAWSMLIFTLANVLITNLMAKSDFRAIKWLVATAILYGSALAFSKPALQELEPLAAYRSVVLLLGLFNVVLFAAAAAFTWAIPPSKGKSRTT